MEEELDDGKNWEIVLIEPFQGNHPGDTMMVAEGLYYTLINLGKAISTDHFDVEEKKLSNNLLHQISGLERENKRYEAYAEKTANELYCLKTKIEQLEEVIEQLEKQLLYFAENYND